MAKQKERFMINSKVAVFALRKAVGEQQPDDWRDVANHIFEQGVVYLGILTQEEITQMKEAKPDADA